MVAAVYLDCNDCIRFRCAVQRDVVPALLCFISGESGVACDVLQLAADAVVADDDLLLQVVYVLTEKIYSCQTVDIDRQA